MTDKEIAEMLLDLFGDPCACNFKNIDEWLPKGSKYISGSWDNRTISLEDGKKIAEILLKGDIYNEQ